MLLSKRIPSMIYFVSDQYRNTSVRLGLNMKPTQSPWRKLLKILKWTAICFAAILVLALSTVLITRAVKAGQAKIDTKNGIQESLYVELNGISQFIQIRGENKENPIIVMLHGGPGSPITFLSSYYQRALEQEYTLVNFDQRGSGRTYYANLTREAPLSTQAVLADVDALIEYLLSRFNQEKVIVLGHSWGTVLGSVYVKEHPEKVAAYIGVGQCVSNMDGDAFTAKEAIRRAQEQGDEESAQKVSALLEQYSVSAGDPSKAFLLAMEMRHIYAPYFHYKGELSMPQTIWLGVSSPDMSLADMRWFFNMSGPLEKFLALEEPLLRDCLSFRLQELGNEYSVPMYYIAGENDWTTPAALVKEYYQTVHAPNKELIILKNAGHNPFLDDPVAFCATVRDLLQNQ